MRKKYRVSEYFFIFSLAGLFSFSLCPEYLGAHEEVSVKEVENEEVTEPHAEHVHNHVSFHKGQVGMSGNFHVEFVVTKGGEYRLYVTDFLRKPVDISRAAGTLEVNQEGREPEALRLEVDEILQEFLVAQGKPRLINDTIVASARISIPGKEPIFIEFAEQIGTSWKGKDGHDGHHH